MLNKVVDDSKFGNKRSATNYSSSMASKSRLVKIFKYGFLFALFWLCLFIYVSTYKLQLIKEFHKKDIDLQKFQQKLTDLVAKGLNFRVHNQPEQLPNDAPVTSEVVTLDDGITAEAKRFAKLLGLVNPGENGEPVELPKNLSDDIQKRIDDGFETQGYNAFVSSMISLNRNIPDVRSDTCKKKVYSSNLPKCSILIPLHNEDWMLLMRTIHSVMIRSPTELIEEILLIDDASDHEILQKPLEDYIKKYPKLKVIRSHRRLGIISNRMMGAVNAVGPVLVFLDSHVEVSPGWLEPLLDRFARDMNVLVWPKVSSIDDKNLRMWLDNEDAGSLGGFAWNMDFNWINVKWFEGDHPTEMWEPKNSPTIIGALFAISKSFFSHVGMLDPDFDIWGGEDVELSFKVWLCGGKVEYVPCSFVAHMYKAHKYSWPKSEKGGYRWNTDRIAEVWLDEYKRYYYRSVGDTKDRNFGDISERLAIKKKLNCKPFKWFIDNVYPNVPIPDKIKDPQPIPKAEKKSKNGTN